MKKIYIVFDEKNEIVRIFSTETKAKNYINKYFGYLTYEEMFVE